MRTRFCKIIIKNQKKIVEFRLLVRCETKIVNFLFKQNMFRK